MSESQNAGTQNVGDAAQNLQQSAAQVGQNVRDLGSQVAGMANQKYQQLRDKASDYYETGRQRANEWEQGLEQYVTEQPVKAVLMAAGVGLLLGLLWKRG